MILAVVAGIVSLRGEWAKPDALPWHSGLFLGLSGIATGLAWLLPRAAVGAGEQGGADRQAERGVFGLCFPGERPSVPVLVGGAPIPAGAMVIALF